MVKMIKAQRQLFESGATRSMTFRIDQLDRLGKGLEAYQDRLLSSLRADLGKSALEAYSTEFGFVMRDIRHAIRQLPKWMRPTRVRTPWMTAPSRAEVQPDPLGVVLILGPWNYPLQLLFSPLVGALAAGNCACLKPSEQAPATAETIRSLISETFPDQLVTVSCGGPETAAELVSQPFDHVFFTGSGRVGRMVLAAAAENLTPVTLELGGKSPCVVCADADPVLSARRIMWGKMLNAGQTCVAPDHVWVEASIRDALLEELKRASYSMVPHRPPQSIAEGYGRILDGSSFDRLRSFLDQGRIDSGGECDRESLSFCPTVLVDIDPGAPVMQEEIFGPILPVLSCRDLDEALVRIKEQPKPLAAYLFTTDRGRQRRFRREVLAGSICINDTISQIIPAELPFGGVGASGFGSYRGRAGFDRFSHPKSVLTRGTRLDPGFRYPPLRTGLKQLKKLFPWMMR